MNRKIKSERRKEKVSKSKFSLGLKFLLQFFLTAPLVFLLFFSLATTSFAASGINHQINFQGKLVKPDGTNVADTTYTIVFSLYTVSSGGSNVWTESDTVTTKDGVFLVSLGANTAFPGLVDFNSDSLYLGLLVGGDAEMTPRIRFSAVPYAFNAEKLDGVVATNSAAQFTLSGSTNSLLTLTVNGSLTLGSTIQPTANGGLTVQSTGANTLTLDTGGAAGLNIGTTANAVTFGATNNPNYAFNGNGTFGTSTGQNSLNGNVLIAANKGLTFDVGTGSISYNIKAGSGGTTTGLIVKVDTTASQVITAANTDTNNAVGVATTTTSSGSNATIAVLGVVTAVADNTVTVGDYIGMGSTTGGRGKSLGSTYPTTSNIQVLGRALTAASAGGNFTLLLNGLDNNTGTAGGANFWQHTSCNSVNCLAPATLTDQLVLGATTTPLAFTGEDIEVNSKGNAALVVANTGGVGDIFTASSGAAPKFVIDGNGNVGIGNPLSLANFLVTVKGDIGPSAGGTYNLGSAATEWNNVFTDKIRGQTGAAFGPNIPVSSVGKGTNPTASVSANSSFAGFIVDNTIGDLFTASSSGLSRFVITQGGSVGVGTTNPQSLLSIAGTAEFGVGDQGTPLAETIRGAAASGNDIAGANFTIDASNGTGNGGSGDLIFRTASSVVSSTITDDGNDNSSFANAASSLTFSHTTAVQSNRIIVVGVAIANKARTVSSVTYAGANLSKLDNASTNMQQDCTTNSATCHIELWYKVGAATGANNVIVNITGGTDNITAGAATYYNVDQTSPVGTYAHGSGSVNPSTAINVTSNTTQLVVDAFTDDNVITSPVAGQTQRWLNNSGNIQAASSSKPGTSSTTSMSWTDTSSDYAIVGVALNPPSNVNADALTDRFHITAAGNIGVGTNTPTSLLSLSDANGAITTGTELNLSATNLTSGTALNIVPSNPKVNANGGTLTSGKIINVASANHTYMALDNKDLTVSGHKNQVTIANVNDTFVYDTTKDIDGGRWTGDERAQSSSWYNETVNHTADACIVGTDTRCGVQSFPKKSIIVVAGSTGANIVYIFDAKDNSLWMSFIQNAGATVALGVNANNTTQSVYALNGRLYIATNGSAATGLYEINFLTDKITRYNTTDARDYVSTIANANTAQTTAYLDQSRTGMALPNAVVNDVFAQVINGSTYITAAQTGGASAKGISLINETAQTVTNLGSTNNKKFEAVWHSEDDILYAINSTDSELDVWYKATTLSANTAASKTYSQTGVNGTLGPALYSSAPTFNSSAPDALFVTRGTSDVDGKSNTIYVAHNAGLSVIQEKQGDETNGSVKYYNSSYITEEMVGNIRGYLPLNGSAGVIANNTNITDPTVKQNAMTVKNANGTGIAYGSGVRGTGITGMDNTDDYICTGTTGTCADNNNFDTTTNSLTVGAWVKRSGTGTDTDTIVAKWGNAIANQAFRLQLNSSNIPSFQTTDGSATTTTTSGPALTDTANWHYISGVYNRSNNTQTLYIDGVQVAESTSISYNTPDSTVAYTIGADLGAAANAAQDFFRGAIDEPFVSASTYTPSEIMHMYQVGYRALNNPNHTGATTIRGVSLAADTANALNGSSIVKAVRVLMDNGQLYIGGSGGVSVIGMDTDTLTDLYSTAINTKDDVNTNYDTTNGNAVNSIYVTKGYGTGVLLGIGFNNSGSGGIWMETNDTTFKDFLASSYNPFGSSLTQSTLNVDSTLRVVGQASSMNDNLAFNGTSQPAITEAFRVDNNGNLLSKSLMNSTTATQFQNASGTTVLNVDTTNNRVGIDTTAPAANLSVSATGIPAGIGLQVIGASNATTETDLDVNGITYVHANAGETGKLSKFRFTDASTLNSAGTTQSIGIDVTGIFNATGASGTHEIYGEYIEGLTTTGSPTGTNNAYGIRIGNQGLGGVSTAYGLYVNAQSGASNNYAAVFAGGNVGIGTTTPGASLDLASGTILGAGLSSDCSATTNRLLWNSTSKQFSCGSDGEGYVKKTADLTMTTNAVLQDDADLHFPVAANSAYEFEAVASASAAGTGPGIKMGINGPAGASVAEDIAWDNAPGAITSGNHCTIVQFYGLGACGFSGGTFNLASSITIHGIIQTGGTSGTITLQWAQQTSNATSTIVHKDAVLKYMLLGTADVAEIYYTNEIAMEAGNLVSVDPTLTAGVKLTTSSYEKSMLGVVSTKPAITIGDIGSGGSPRPIALTGRVPVKVITENGSIHAGDYLTSSSTPGVAMKATKAGPVVGMALSGFDGDGVGSVIVFIKPTFYNGITLTDLLPAAQQSDKQYAFEENVLNKFMQDNKQASTSGQLSDIVTDRLVATREIITPNLFADTIYAHIIKADRIEGLEILTNKISQLDTSISSLSANVSVLGASTSADIVKPFATTSGFLSLTGLSVDNNATISGDLRVKGSGLFEGMLSVIDTFKSDNFIATGLAEFFNTVVFHHDVAFEGRPTFNQDTAGFAVIKKGMDHVDISFVKEYETTPIINATLSLDVTISPVIFPASTSAQERQILDAAYTYVIGRRTTKGFTIILNKTATEDVPFSWSALLVKDPKIFQSLGQNVLIMPTSTVSLPPVLNRKSENSSLSATLQ